MSAQPRDLEPVAEVIDHVEAVRADRPRRTKHDDLARAPGFLDASRGIGHESPGKQVRKAIRYNESLPVPVKDSVITGWETVIVVARCPFSQLEFRLDRRMDFQA